MPDEATVQNTSEEQTEVQAPVVKNPFDESNWANEPITKETQVDAATTEVKNEAVVTAPLSEQNELKANLGFDKWDDAKAEFDNLKKLKEQQPQEVKYANDESKRLHELILAGNKKEAFKILEQQERLDEITSLEVTNKDSAEKIVKTAMQFKHKDLTQDEVNYKFSKQFGVPPKPVQLNTEDEDDYKERVQAWEEKVSDAEKELIIEAKLMRPELEKYKTELVLPEIKKEETSQKQPTQEELAAAQKSVDDFKATIDPSLKEFSGFTATVSYKDGDKDVSLPVAYGLSDDEKAEISQQLTTFAEHGLNANALLAQRWLSKDGAINTAQMVKDLSRMLYGDKVEQKFASEAANKRLDAYQKEKKNINLNGQSGQGTFTPDQDGKTEQVKMAEHFFSN